MTKLFTTKTAFIVLSKIVVACLLTCYPGIHARSQAKALPYFPPYGQWESRKPAAMGFDAVALDSAVAFAIVSESKAPRDLRAAHYQSAFGREPFGFPVGPMKERGPATGLIIRKGYIVAQWGEPERVDLTFSVAKSFLSTVVGLAYDSGLIRDVHDRVGPYMAPIIPYEPFRMAGNKSDELGGTDIIDLFATEHNRKITWDHLLRQTSDWEGVLWDKPDWADRPEKDAASWTNRPRHEPGTVYKYNDTRVNVLALAALNIWRRPLPQVLKEKLMDPIGASPTWRWTGYENSWVVMDGQLLQSVSGGSHWGGGMFISAIDQARFGLLTLRNGNWKGKQLISPQWLKMARTPTLPEPTYGFMNFFLNTGNKLYPSVPEQTFAHIGAGTNLVFVDPERELLVVARWIENGKIDEFLKRVYASLRDK
ncbi:serine hydrolase [Flavihumibacter rivuli]|uniref:serine hydrolase domain-containing protein n=1 Tax=Flavihumibacter rivuli TaxID=2838156 RepID=UPI001BDDE575|nr:serine hydrolase [Flavihumibacter rivuli]ULQ57360.1 serine hydrolase [Flavihumibacter rivuli]